MSLHFLLILGNLIHTKFVDQFVSYHTLIQQRSQKFVFYQCKHNFIVVLLFLLIRILTIAYYLNVNIYYYAIYCLFFYYSLLFQLLLLVLIFLRKALFSRTRTIKVACRSVSMKARTIILMPAPYPVRLDLRRRQK